MKILPLILLTACTASPDDPIDDVPYPGCTSATEQCLERIPVGDRMLPIYRNVSLVTPNPAITQAVIVIQNGTRNANNMFYAVATAASQSGLDDKTAILAPHFECNGDDPPAGDVYWACDDNSNGWVHGIADASGAESPIYAYAIVDQLVHALANKATFPHLTRVVVTGMSGGGQFTQRYAASNLIDPVAGVAMSYTVVAPSSFMWPNANRPDALCDGYDTYPYGLEQLAGYLTIPGEATIAKQLATRDVHYLVGSEDTLANAPGTGLDTSCHANAEGVDRIERMTNYTQALGVTPTVVPGCMHSHACMFYSPEGRAAILGD